MEVFWDQNFSSLLSRKHFQDDICKEYLLDCGSWSLVKFILNAEECLSTFKKSNQRKPGLQKNSNSKEQEIKQYPFLSLKVTPPYIFNFYFYHHICFSWQLCMAACAKLWMMNQSLFQRNIELAFKRLCLCVLPPSYSRLHKMIIYLLVRS